MVPWWKKLLFSWIAWTSAGVCNAIWQFTSGVLIYGEPLDPRQLIYAFETSLLFVAVVWLITIPAALLVSNPRSWRFWMYWVLGSCIGPALVIGLLAAIRYRSFDPAHAWWKMLISPLIGSSLAAFIHLFLLRSAQTRALAAKS
jgi:hypothetical protein